MKRAIKQGIDNLEELEWIECEEREAEAARQAETSMPNPASSVDAVDWDAFVLDPSLSQILGSGGSPPVGSSSVQGAR